MAERPDEPRRADEPTRPDEPGRPDQPGRPAESSPDTARAVAAGGRVLAVGAATGSPEEVVDRAVPVGVRIAGAWSWRMIGVIALIAVAAYLVILLHIVVVPLLVASLLSGLLTPIKNRLLRLGLPKGIAVAITFLGLLLAIAGLILLVILTVRSGLGNFESHVNGTIRNLRSLLATAPFGITADDLQNGIDSALKTVRSNSGSLLAGALTGASTVGDILVGLVLSLFVTLFFLIDGAGIWRWCVRLAPKRARAAVDGAGHAAWLSVGEYVRVQVLVAFIDATGIGLVAFFLHLPFVVPIAVLVFLSAFIPFVGAIASGALAVLIALVYLNPVAAIIMLAGVIFVNQLEAHVLQPLMMGGAVRLHPVAVVLTVATGSLLAGIPGAVFAVPFVAASNSAIMYIAGGAWKGAPQPPTGDMPRQPEGGDERKERFRRRHKPQPQDVTTVA